MLELGHDPSIRIMMLAPDLAAWFMDLGPAGVTKTAGAVLPLLDQVRVLDLRNRPPGVLAHGVVVEDPLDDRASGFPRGLDPMIQRIRGWRRLLFTSPNRGRRGSAQPPGPGLDIHEAGHDVQVRDDAEASVRCFSVDR